MENSRMMRVIIFNIGWMAALTFWLSACQNDPVCRDLSGTWNDREGHTLVFQSDSSGLWLNRFGQMVDTIHFVFSLQCAVKPAAINLSGFDGGPMLGKSLFGILEFSGDTLFRLCYEIGQDAGIRPAAFDPEQTMRFYR